MDDEFYVDVGTITLKDHRIVDFSKFPERFWSFLKSLDNINGVQIYENEGITFILSPPAKWKGDDNVYILVIVDRKKLKERFKPRRERKHRPK